MHSLAVAALTCPSSTQSHRKLVPWLRKHQVEPTVMEASGDFERGRARMMREAGIQARIVDAKRVRSFALSGDRLAKNEAIDAELIARFAETSVRRRARNTMQP